MLRLRLPMAAYLVQVYLRGGDSDSLFSLVGMDVLAGRFLLHVRGMHSTLR